MSAFRPQLSWSKSRDGALAECARRYYYQYYGWIGWSEPRADPRAQADGGLAPLTQASPWCS